MLIRTMQELESQGRVVSISHGKSTAVRLLTKADGLNFSISEARAQQAGQADLWYKHPLLPTSPRESRFSLAYSHPYEGNLMTWRATCRSRPRCTRSTNWTN